MFNRFVKVLFIQYNPDIGDPDIREIFLSGPKLESVLPKQNRLKPDIRDLFSGSDNSLISELHCKLDPDIRDLYILKRCSILNCLP